MIDHQKLATHFQAPAGAQVAAKKAAEQAKVFNDPELELFFDNLEKYGLSTHKDRTQKYNNFKLRNSANVILKAFGLEIKRRIITHKRAGLLDFDTSFNFYVLGWCE